MEPTVIVTGIGIGLLLAAPVGPIGILCMRRTLTQGLAAGLTAGLGAATGHALLSGLVAASAHWLAGWTGVLRIVGGLVLLRVGWKILRFRPSLSAGRPETAKLREAFTGTLILQLANSANSVMVLLSYVLGTMAVEGSVNLLATLGVTGGVFLGSILWWTALGLVVYRLREWITPGRVVAINRLSGGVVIGFGVRLLVLAAYDLGAAC